jgi:hypothetical protein
MLSSLTLVLQRFSSQAHPSASTASQVQQSRGALLQKSVTTLATMLSLPTKTAPAPDPGQEVAHAARWNRAGTRAHQAAGYLPCAAYDEELPGALMPRQS